MPRKDLTGQQFGRLTVLHLDEEKTKEKKQSYYVCQCECGNIKTIFGSSLTTGRTKSCGCLQKEKLSIDITGQRFGKLVALYKTTSQIGKNGITKTRWHCKCDCGNECDVLTECLRQGDTTSCGCKMIEYRERADNLIGQKFGKLLVLEKDINFSKEQKKTYWKCLCDCGNIKTVYHTCLTSGDTSSCGCLKSKGENSIETILKENNIQYVKEYWFKDLIGEGGAHLRYDFAIIFNNNVCGLIEYNGIQHYESIDFFGGEEQLNKQKRQDLLKQEYCNKNNYPFLIVSYKDNDMKERILSWYKSVIWTQSV